MPSTAECPTVTVEFKLSTHTESDDFLQTRNSKYAKDNAKPAENDILKRYELSTESL